jgi:hypothetical protein
MQVQGRTLLNASGYGLFGSNIMSFGNYCKSLTGGHRLVGSVLTCAEI